MYEHLQTHLEQVCRLARTMSLPHEVGHTVLVDDSESMSCMSAVYLAADLAGFTVVRPSFLSATTARGEKLNTFRSDLIDIYRRAGSKVIPLTSTHDWEFFSATKHCFKWNSFNYNQGLSRGLAVVSQFLS